MSETKIRLFNAHINDLLWRPLEDQKSKWVLDVTAPLTLKAAEALKCRNMFFDENGVARTGFTGMVGINQKFTEATPVELGDRLWDAQLVHNFKVGRQESAAASDITLHVSMKMHFDGADPVLWDWAQGVGKGDFSFTLDPPQMAFKFEAATEDGAATSDSAASNEGEKQETASGKPEQAKADELDTGCIACNNSIPLREEGIHDSGARCTKRKGPALVSMNKPGKTTQERRRERKRELDEARAKAAENPVETEEDAADLQPVVN